MLLVAKLLVLLACVGGSVGVTRGYLAERSILAESGVQNRAWLLAVGLLWVCVIALIASVFPRLGTILIAPIPLGALLAIPPVFLLRKIRRFLERQGTDRTKIARDITDRALLIGYGAAALVIIEWVVSLAVLGLPNITGGQV